MNAMTDLLPAARPRERLGQLGAPALGDTELVALVLGHGTRGRDVLTTAAALLRRFGSLPGLLDADPQELSRIPGIGPTAAARLAAAVELGKRALCHQTDARPVLRCARDVHLLLRPVVAGLQKEVFWALALDARHRLLRQLRIAEGSLLSVDVHPREVFRPLIRLGAAATILAHNHPSGDATPSPDDLELTQRLQQVGVLTGIPVLDHVVVTLSTYVSVSEAEAP
jgi:DNA repair protein RadC